MSSRSAHYWLVVSGLLWSLHGPAWAQNSADKAAADALFSEGKRLIATGDTEAACAKFEASLVRVIQLGTQLALASCYEKLGKTASAWVEFRAAASAASKAHDSQREHFAEGHATALEAKLSKLMITVEPGYRIDGLRIKRDGAEVPPAELGSPMPVDPGEHTVEASAPGWNPWSTVVSVAAMPGVVTVVIPALGKAPIKIEEPRPEPVAPSPPPAPDPPEASNNRRYLAYAVGGGGIVVLGTSLILGSMASSRWSDARQYCHDGVCDRTGFDLANSAKTLGNVATGTFIVGLAGLGTGVALYLTAPSTREARSIDKSTALRVVPAVTPTEVGFALLGGF